MLEKLNKLCESHGEIRPGRGLASGVVALTLAVLCFLGALAFHFPEYLTTPQLRKSLEGRLKGRDIKARPNSALVVRLRLRVVFGSRRAKAAGWSASRMSSSGGPASLVPQMPP
jgi:hypothetical protein